MVIVCKSKKLWSPSLKEYIISRLFLQVETFVLSKDLLMEHTIQIHLLYVVKDSQFQKYSFVWINDLSDLDLFFSRLYRHQRKEKQDVPQKLTI